MSSIYSPLKTTSTAKNFQAFFNVDPNAWVSAVLKRSLDESKRLYNDSPIPHAIIDTLTRYVIGTGLTPKSAPDREYLGWSVEEGNEFTREAESFFNLITSSSDFDFYLGGIGDSMDVVTTAVIAVFDPADGFHQIGGVDFEIVTADYFDMPFDLFTGNITLDVTAE